MDLGREGSCSGCGSDVGEGVLAPLLRHQGASRGAEGEGVASVGTLDGVRADERWGGWASGGGGPFHL